MSASVKWVDEPPRRWAPRRKPIITPEQEAELRAHPNRWAEVVTFPGPSSAHQARKRWADGPGHLRPEEWEFQARKHGDGTSTVYARYTGPGQAPDQGPDGESSPDEAPGGSHLARPQEPAPAMQVQVTLSPGATLNGIELAATADEPSGFEAFVDPARDPLEDRTCKVCGEVKESAHGLKVHVGRRHKGQLHGLSDGQGGTLTTAAVAAAIVENADLLDDDDDEHYEEQVGVINGVCGPCRRMRCFLCATAGCKCARPSHFAQARVAT